VRPLFGGWIIDPLPRERPALLARIGEDSRRAGGKFTVESLERGRYDLRHPFLDSGAIVKSDPMSRGDFDWRCDTSHDDECDALQGGRRQSADAADPADEFDRPGRSRQFVALR